MGRITKHILGAVIVFTGASLLFSVMPWVPVISGWGRYYLITLRASELLGLYVLTCILMQWAGVEAARWSRIRVGFCILGALLLLLSVASYLQLLEQTDSPLIQDYLVRWMSIPYWSRITLSVGILALATFAMRVGTYRTVLIAMMIGLALFRLAPELHVLVLPIEYACC